MVSFIDKDFTYLVVGASRNPRKYGHRVFKDLLEAGYKVAPVNPNSDELLGVKVLKNVGEYKGNVDVAIIVVPSTVGDIVLDELVAKNIKNVWFQPGSESESLIERCESLGLNCSSGKCIMIERQKV